MLARLAVLPRLLLIVLAIGAATATATVTFAASQRQAPPAAAPAVAPAAPVVLVVPDVRKQAYVFAKGTLEDAGLAWRVSGRVEGYAANLVVAQAPAPGTRLIDNGAPTIALTLARNAAYDQEGEPQNAAPYRGTPVRIADLASVLKPAAAPKRLSAPKPAAKPRPAARPEPAAKPAGRTPAFLASGAPREPLDEITLAARARQLETWLESHRRPTDANVRHWLYQHAWIVTGARFGWSHGAESLRVLIGVDRKVEARWGVGSRSRVVAQRALAHVQARTR